MKMRTRRVVGVILAILTAHCSDARFAGNAREGSNPENSPPNTGAPGGGPDNKPVDPRDNPSSSNPGGNPGGGTPGGGTPGGGNPGSSPMPGGTYPSNDPNKPGGSNPNDPNNPNNPGGLNQNGGHGTEKTFTTTCETSADGSRPVVEFSESRDIKMIGKVTGEFCPKAQRILNVMFIVDWSGSMGRHTRTGTNAPSNGHDPQVNGSCGRLRAAQQVVAQLKAQRKPNDQVSLSFVAFAGGSLPRRTLKSLPLDQFEAQLTKERFCSYVVQDASFGYDPQNPGGVNGASEGMTGVSVGYSGTNYKEALDSASAALRGLGGRKVVYFITDGEPTAGGSNPAQAGIDAGNRFRNSVDNLTLNALMLGHDEPNATDILRQVAGSPDRVRTADDAQALATQILQFPDAAGIDEGSATAQVQVAPNSPKALGMKYLRKDPNREARWVFETQPFILLGIPGIPVNNEVTVKAAGKDGSTYQSFITIRYTQR